MIIIIVVAAEVPHVPIQDIDHPLLVHRHLHVVHTVDHDLEVTIENLHVDRITINNNQTTMGKIEVLIKHVVVEEGETIHVVVEHNPKIFQVVRHRIEMVESISQLYRIENCPIINNQDH